MVSVALVHDTRREKKNHTYPVRLRVTYGRQVKVFSRYPLIFQKKTMSG
jgi:hypothetical protein